MSRYRTVARRVASPQLPPALRVVPGARELTGRRRADAIREI